MREPSEAEGAGSWMQPAFWAQVDFEIEHVDTAELRRFLRAGGQCNPIRPGFEAELWVHLRRRCLDSCCCA